MREFLGSPSRTTRVPTREKHALSRSRVANSSGAKLSSILAVTRARVDAEFLELRLRGRFSDFRACRGRDSQRSQRTQVYAKIYEDRFMAHKSSFMNFESIVLSLDLCRPWGQSIVCVLGKPAFLGQNLWLTGSAGSAGSPSGTDREDKEVLRSPRTAGGARTMQWRAIRRTITEAPSWH